LPPLENGNSGRRTRLKALIGGGDSLTLFWNSKNWNGNWIEWDKKRNDADDFIRFYNRVWRGVGFDKVRDLLVLIVGGKSRIRRGILKSKKREHDDGQ
tara:strand:+ start:2047 stop:2340 length:294 start_codon:yes stop_codon:yes gene_type:complete